MSIDAADPDTLTLEVVKDGKVLRTVEGVQGTRVEREGITLYALTAKSLRAEKPTAGCRLTDADKTVWTITKATHVGEGERWNVRVERQPGP